MLRGSNNQNLKVIRALCSEIIATRTEDGRQTTHKFPFHELCWHSQAELKMPLTTTGSKAHHICAPSFPKIFTSLYCSPELFRMFTRHFETSALNVPKTILNTTSSQGPCSAPEPQFSFSFARSTTSYFWVQSILI